VTANRDVFINCPFDPLYQPLFRAIVFTIVRSGFKARCALEIDDGGENRFAKICRIVAQCRYSIHDISRTETDGDPPLPRFNMPLELGLFLGARHLGAPDQRRKRCIIFDTQPYRYQKFISDIAGQDIHAHGSDANILIQKLAAWLRDQSGDGKIPGGNAIKQDFHSFLGDLPAACAKRQLMLDELTFQDYNSFVSSYLTA
jgi:hypothetical protein